MNIAKPSVRGNPAAVHDLVEVGDEKGDVDRKKSASHASAAHSGHRHSFQTTKKAREVVATHRARDRDAVGVGQGVGRTEQQHQRQDPQQEDAGDAGMKICPSWVEEVWTISRRGSNPSWIAWLASE